MIILYVLLALLVLLAMVTIHEFGHYTAGKLLGFKINEFSVGFGKKLYSKKKANGEIFSLRLVPLGGYCAFEGENEGAENQDGFNAQKPWKRLIVLLCGPLFNIISGIFFSFILLVGVGYDIPEIVVVNGLKNPNEYVLNLTDESMPLFNEKDVILEIKKGEEIILTNDGKSSINVYEKLNAFENNTQFTFKIKRNGAEINLLGQFKKDANALKVNSNLESGDVIRKINGTKINHFKGNSFLGLLSTKNPGETVQFTIERDGKIQNVNVDIFEYINANGVVSSGIGVQSKPYAHNFWEALGRSFSFTFEMAGQILAVFGQLITGQIGFSSLGGPITTIGTIATYSSTSIVNLLILLPLIAVNLGVFNLIPFPALDGARMVFTLIEWVRGKPINSKVENTIHTVGLILLFGLVIIADLYQIIIRIL